MKYYRKEFSGFSFTDEDDNVKAISSGKANFCHPLLKYIPQEAVETPEGVDLLKFVMSDTPLLEKYRAIASAFDCLSRLHETYHCYHLDAKASNFIVYDCDNVYLIDFETMCRLKTSPLPGEQDTTRFDDMASSLFRFGFRPHLHYSLNSDIAYRYDVFSLASSLFEHARFFLPRKFLELLETVIVAGHKEKIVEVHPDGKKFIQKTYLTNPNVPILPANITASFVRSFTLRPLKRSHSI